MSRPRIRFQACFVAHGNRDSEKDQLVHDSTPARQSSVRLLVAMAAIMGFEVWTEDISQAYLQSASELLREVDLKPNRQQKVPAGYVSKLLRPLYRLSDSGDNWHATFAKHLTHDLGMKAVSSDMSLFFRHARGQLTGLLASYVNDTLACGDRSFVDVTAKTREAFEVKSREHNKMRFSGVYVNKLNDGFEIQQRAYIDRLKRLPRDADFVQLRRARDDLSWLVHSRPDICVIASKLAQVTETTFERKHISMFSNAIGYLL